MPWRRSRSRFAIVLLLVVSLVAVTAVSSFYYSGFSLAIAGEDTTNSCSGIVPANFSYVWHEHRKVCGIGSVSDGLLTATLHNYYFNRTRNSASMLGQNLEANQGDDVFLLANATIANVGPGNTSVGPAYMTLNDGKGNGEYLSAAYFPGIYPDMAFPDDSGGLYLPPHGSADVWLLFDLGNRITTSNVNLSYLQFHDNDYGGTYDGHGSTNCQKVACKNPAVDLVLAVR